MQSQFSRLDQPDFESPYEDRIEVNNDYPTRSNPIQSMWSNPIFVQLRSSLALRFLVSLIL